MQTLSNASQFTLGGTWELKQLQLYPFEWQFWRRQYGSQIDFYQEQTQTDTVRDGDLKQRRYGSKPELTHHVRYIKLMQLSVAVTFSRIQASANMYTRLNRMHVTPPHPETPTSIKEESTYNICLDTYHSPLILLGSVRMPEPISKQAETLSPFRQTGSPLTSCTVLVSYLNNKITSRIIQLFSLQSENARTAVTMRMSFPPGK